MESVLDESRRNERYYEKKYRDQTYEYMKRLHWMENKEATQAREEAKKKRKQERYEELQEESRIRVRAEMEERHRIEQTIMTESKPKLFHLHGNV